MSDSTMSAADYTANEKNRDTNVIRLLVLQYINSHLDTLKDQIRGLLDLKGPSASSTVPFKLIMTQIEALEDKKTKVANATSIDSIKNIATSDSATGPILNSALSSGLTTAFNNAKTAAAKTEMDSLDLDGDGVTNEQIAAGSTVTAINNSPAAKLQKQKDEVLAIISSQNGRENDAQEQLLVRDVNTATSAYGIKVALIKFANATDSSTYTDGTNREALIEQASQAIGMPIAVISESSPSAAKLQDLKDAVLAIISNQNGRELDAQEQLLTRGVNAATTPDEIKIAILNYADATNGATYTDGTNREALIEQAGRVIGMPISVISESPASGQTDSSGGAGGAAAGGGGSSGAGSSGGAGSAPAPQAPTDYSDIIRRIVKNYADKDATQADLDHWNGMLNKPQSEGGMSVNGMLVEIANGSVAHDFQNRVLQPDDHTFDKIVNQVFQNYAGVDADPTSLRIHGAALKNGMTLPEFQEMMKTSPIVQNYVATHPISDAKFIEMNTLMTQAVQTPVFAQPSPTDVAPVIVASSAPAAPAPAPDQPAPSTPSAPTGPAPRVLTGDAKFVNDIYKNYLGREATDTEIASDVGSIQGRGAFGRNSYHIDFIKRGDVTDHLNSIYPPQNHDFDAIVNQVFRDYAGVDADPESLRKHGAALNGGMSLPQFQEVMKESQYVQSHLASDGISADEYNQMNTLMTQAVQSSASKGAYVPAKPGFGASTLAAGGGFGGDTNSSAMPSGIPVVAGFTPEGP